jgi:hypothetical protein
MASEIPYTTSEMLPTVDYSTLEDNIFGNNLVALEFQTLENLREFTEQLKEILLENNMVQVPEFMVAHLSMYLGVLTVYCLGLEASETLYPQIMQLLETQATKR